MMIKRLLLVTILSVAVLSAGLGLFSIKHFTLFGWLLFSTEIFAGVTVFLLCIFSIILGYAWVFNADSDESFLTYSKNLIESLRD